MTWARGSTRQSRRQRAIVLRRDPVCYLHYDGCTIYSTEDDHVIPLSQGGSDHLDNRRGACHRCHRKKSQSEAAQGKQAKRHRPAEPHPGLIDGPVERQPFPARNERA